MATEHRPIEYDRVATPGPGSPTRRWSLPGRLPPAELVVGLALGLTSIRIYGLFGYSRGMLLLWLAAALILATFFWSTSAVLPRIATADLVAPSVLMLLFAPLYLTFLYRWPVQVSSDETAVMGVARTYGSMSGVDLFGPSTHFNRPALLFVAWGKLGDWIGGIDLVHMRFLHAMFALIVIAISYGLFRQLLPLRWAFFASCVLGLSHSFLMISRLAMRENTAVLIEVTALALLVRGLRHDHAFLVYCGGFVAGLGFYVYEPGRAVLPLCVVFLVGAGLLARDRFPLRKLLRLGSVAAVGFALMATPIMIAGSKTPPSDVSQTAQLLITHRGRQVQQRWVGAASETDGVKTNISWGLTTFNNHVVDHGWIYQNVNHGFVDPLTGILLWIGVAAVGLRLLRRRRRGDEPWPLLMLAGFLALWLAFAFLINKAPNYTRLLITLPFVAYLVTEAVRLLGLLLKRGLTRFDRARASRAAAAVAAGTLAALAAGNLAIAWDFIDEGRKTGDEIGSTGRYIASHANEDFYIAGDENTDRYFTFGNPGLDRMSFFTHGDQQVGSVDPLVVQNFGAPRPFAIFMTVARWNVAGTALKKTYPDANVRNVTRDGRLVVFEVPAQA